MANIKTLIFLRPFTVRNPTLEKQTAFLERELVNKTECAELGEIYSTGMLQGEKLHEFIKQKIADNSPEWIIAEGESATAAIAFTGVKKILINPRVTEQTIEKCKCVYEDFDYNHTTGFFSESYESDYERFHAISDNVLLKLGYDELTLFFLKELIEEYLEGAE